MVALVVLADHLPMPEQISFQGEGAGEPGTSIMSMSFPSIVQGQAWSRHLGGRTDILVGRYTGQIHLDEGPIRWHGWTVHLHASEDEPLDAATAARVAVIVAGGDV
jgi:hypothetical protein